MVRKLCVFQRKIGHISETVSDTSDRLLLITNRKWHTPFQMKWKSSTLDDLQGRDNQYGREHPSDN